MTALEAQLLQQLQKLPPDRIAEVLDFATFLAAREERNAAARRLGESMAKLHALDLPAPGDDEIEQAIHESRHARRQASDEADQAHRASALRP